MKVRYALLMVVMLVSACATTNEKLIGQFESYGLESREIDRGVLVILPDIFFEFDKYDLTPQARTKLQSAAQVLNEDLASDRQIAIEGHTDSIGDDQYNLDLSLRRASTVEKELLFSKVSEERMKAEGFGETRPVESNRNPDGSDSAEGRAKNRRVELIILNPGQR